MGFGRIVLSKMLRVVLPFAGVVVPVIVLFYNFLELIAMHPGVNVDLFGVIAGAMIFCAAIGYMGFKQERAVEKEDE